RPMVFAYVSSVSSLPVAIIALLGMQSQRCAAPPTMSRSIIVTSAPSDAATVAAVFPAGPPPMITKRTGTSPGYAQGPAYPDQDARAAYRRADGDERDRRAGPRDPAGHVHSERAGPVDPATR